MTRSERDTLQKRWQDCFARKRELRGFSPKRQAAGQMLLREGASRERLSRMQRRRF
jgi:hypothetical protein